MNRYKAREAIEDILHPLNGYRGKLEAQGKQVTNHIKQNRISLKSKEQEFSKKQETASVAHKTPT